MLSARNFVNMTSGTMKSNNATSFGNDGPIILSKIVFSITASITLVGNLFVVYLFIRHPKWLSKSHNRCILNLAITDILTALSLFILSDFIVDEAFYQVASQSYLARELYCRFIWSHFVPFSLGITSLCTCLVLALERWLAVTKSLFYKNRFKTKHMNILIVASWIAGFVCEIPVAVSARGIYDQAPIVCRWSKGDIQKSLTISMFLTETLVPFVLIFAAYVDIFRTIKGSIRFRATTGNESLNNVTRLKKVTQMTAIASFTLLICWLPGQTNFFLYNLGYNSMSLVGSSDDLLTIILNVLVFFNSCLNPFIYVFSNATFRKAFKEHFCSFSLIRLSLK